MLGRLIGELAAAPLRIANVPVKLATKAVNSLSDQPTPKRNALDEIADELSETIEDTLDN